MREQYEPDLRSVAADFDFPVASYLRGQIRDAMTLTRTGRWWSAALLIEDPRHGKRYVAVYRWHFRDGDWKRVSKFVCRSKGDADKIRSFLDTHYATLS
ncbi:MAG: hypothetical protein OYK82_12290 [Gammaproteobacteria bacterium]|nr:hypothetical protein [Gammaproteobacteria bacterium]